MKFLGHVIGKEGISADPEKTRPVREMEAPQSVSDRRRFLGIPNQLD